MTQKATKEKIDKLELINSLRNLCIRRQYQWSKEQLTKWEKIFTSIISDKGLMSEYRENFKKFIQQKQTTQKINAQTT